MTGGRPRRSPPAIGTHSRWRRFLLAVLAPVLLVGGAPNGPARAADNEPDVLVYGGTPGGVIAAVAAARAGAVVVLVEPSDHLGGMMSNGLSWTDRGDPTVIGGMADEFFDRMEATEGSLRGRFAFQPHTAEAIFEAMASEAGVSVVRDALGPEATVVMDGARIDQIAFTSGATYRPAVAIDASYEGDLMAAAGVSYRVGREGRDAFGESLAGVGATEVVMPIPPGLDAGVPLTEPGPVGSADGRIMASNFRLCVSTDPANRVPFAAPPGYDAGRYDLVAAYFAHRLSLGHVPERDWAVHVDRTIRSKWDMNAVGPVSISLPGANYEYPEASPAQRAEIAAAHREYQAGYLHFLVTDPRVPQAIRTSMQAFGLCADEFTDNGNWPRLLYLREGRRMEGTDVVTQHDVVAIRSKPDVIGLASYKMDSHRVSRWIDDDGWLVAEGGINSLAPMRWSLPYRIITPDRAEATNLLVPVAASASHVAYTSLRMEPQYMILGQAAGVAAAMAAATDVAVQDIPVDELQDALLATGAVLDDPGDIGSSTFYHEIAWAYFEGIIGPCGGPGFFCPNQAVTRQMMAAFLARALDLPPATEDYFTDDESSSMESSINRVAEAGITTGCGSSRFCPTRVVTRAEMATFLVRAYGLPPASEDHFTDDESFASHEDEINALAEAGIATGCAAGRYCPGASVTRGQMMAFLFRVASPLATGSLSTMPRPATERSPGSIDKG